MPARAGVPEVVFGSAPVLAPGPELRRAAPARAGLMRPQTPSSPHRAKPLTGSAILAVIHGQLDLAQFDVQGQWAALVLGEREKPGPLLRPVVAVVPGDVAGPIRGPRPRLHVRPQPDWAELRGGRWIGTLDSISCDDTASRVGVSASRGTVTTSSLSTVSRCPLAVARFPAGEVAGENMNTRHLPAG